MSGVIALRNATTGANVSAGTVLFRVVDASQVHVVGQVPEAEAARARPRARPRSRSPGSRLPAGRLISIGKVLESPSRTLPITFALEPDAGIPVGQAIVLHLLMDTTPPRPVVPAAAVVDDAGRPIVFVQRGGETFERRAVTLGPRSGDVRADHRRREAGRSSRHERCLSRAARVVVNIGARAWACALSATFARWASAAKEVLMIDGLIRWSLSHRTIVVALAAAFLVGRLDGNADPLGRAPGLTAPTVTILAKRPGWIRWRSNRSSPSRSNPR